MRRGWKQRIHQRISSRGNRFRAGSEPIVVKNGDQVAVYKPEFLEAMKQPIKRLPKKDYSDVLTGPGTTTMDAEMRKAQGRKLLADFEDMKEMAELKALSAASLERKLSDSEYKRMMELGKARGLVK